MNRPQMLLVTAAAVFGDEPFTVWDLTIHATERYPKAFSMPGYLGLGSDNTVKSCLCGKNRLPAKGLLRKVGPSRYRLTDAGREEVARALAAGGTNYGVTSRRNANRKRKAAADPWVRSRLAWVAARPASAASYDEALGFWGGTGRAAVDDFLERLKALPDGPPKKAITTTHRTLYMRFYKQLGAGT